MDAIYFNRRPRKRNQDTATLDLLNPVQQPPREKIRKAPYQLSSATSREAAERITPRTKAMRDKILAELRKVAPRGLTRKEIERRIPNLITPTATARLNELWESQDVRKLTTTDGRGKVVIVRREDCAVYVLDNHGEDAA